MRFAGGTTYLRKKGIAFLPITCAGAPNPLPSVFQPLYSMESLLVLKQPSCSIVRIRNECWTPFEISKQVERYRQIQRFFFTRCVSQIDMYTMERVFEQRSKL